jgi:hypothetical protein
LKTCCTCKVSKPLSEFGTVLGKPRKNCKVCKNIESKNYRENNKEKIREYTKKIAPYRKQYIKEWYAKNKDTQLERMKEYSKSWRKEFKEKNCKKSNDYRSRKLQAIPKWVDSEENFLIEEVYHLAKLREQATGIKWHVDHIVPLCGKEVCGLHTINNLQVIPATINFRKSNILLESVG